MISGTVDQSLQRGHVTSARADCIAVAPNNIPVNKSFFICITPGTFHVPPNSAPEAIVMVAVHKPSTIHLSPLAYPTIVYRPHIPQELTRAICEANNIPAKISHFISQPPVSFVPIVVTFEFGAVRWRSPIPTTRFGEEPDAVPRHKVVGKRVQKAVLIDWTHGVGETIAVPDVAALDVIVVFVAKHPRQQQHRYYNEGFRVHHDDRSLYHEPKWPEFEHSQWTRLIIVSTSRLPVSRLLEIGRRWTVIAGRIGVWTVICAGGRAAHLHASGEPGGG